jgi:cytochrome b561
MTLRNTADNYGTIAKVLHWTTALLFLGSYVSVYYRHWFTAERTPANMTALQLHLSIGVSIAVVVALRILWRLSNPVPDPAPGNALEHWAAKLGHLALYAVMIVMPITGYLGTGSNTNYFFLFEIPGFKGTELFTEHFGQTMPFEEFEKPFDFIHKEVLGKRLAWVLIVGHVLAALYHHFNRHDRTLKKMTTGA